jgi:hypothetical protein
MVGTMKELYYTVFQDILQRFPGYVCGIIVAHELACN